MIEENENGQDGEGEINTGMNIRGNRKVFLAAGIAAAVIVLVIGVWYFWPGGGGQAVPAPSSTAFNENSQPGLAGGQLVTIDPEQVERIGIKTDLVGETISDEALEIASTGVVQPNAYKETPVYSLLGGVVRKTNAELGDEVGSGAVLMVLFSDDLAAAQANYLSLGTDARLARQNYERAARLEKLNPVNRAELDQVMAKRVSDEAALEEARLRYNRTVKLVEIGASSREDLERDLAKFRAAQAEVDQSVKQFDRSAELVSINPVSSTEFEAAAIRLTTAESELARARQRLQVLGLSEKRINGLTSPAKINSEIGLPAPVSGTITSRKVNAGEIIEANKELFRVTNLDTVWVIAQAFEKDLPRLAVGGFAAVKSAAFPERVFRGKVTYIDPNFDQQTRTAQVRIELDNPGHILKIGMYVDVAFGAVGTGEKSLPAVPASAVQNMAGNQFVFVTTQKPNVFVMKQVRLGTEKEGRYPVLEGVTVGERIVTEGSFFLRAEFSKQNIGNQ